MTKLMELYNSYLAPASDMGLNLGGSSFRWKNFYADSIQSVRVLIGSNITASSATVTTLVSTSASITSLTFTKSVGSSVVLSNSNNAYINVKIFTHNAAGLVSGDVWFFASSNRVYLAINSITSTYFVAMNT